jgi:AcrR family transcriptional regulator
MSAEQSTTTHRGPGRPRLDDEMVPRILDAAERLFAKNDSLDVSIRDIAAEAGVPHARIYRYFDGKDDVLRQMMERGRERQFAYEAERRASDTGVRGTLDWIMTENRPYSLAVARAAMAGETPSSLGVDASVQLSRRARDLFEGSGPPFRLRDDYAPAVVVAAANALVLGWVACEDWLVESAGLQDADRTQLRAEIDELMLSLMTGQPVDGANAADEGALWSRR